MSGFVATHRRKDGLPAMLLAIHNGEALYSVEWFDNNKRHQNTLVRSESVFRDQFKPVRS